MSSRCEIVIPTRDRPDRLARCLTSLLGQTESDIRVIVVDDCGSESVDDVVDESIRAGLDATLIRMPTPSGPAAARNAGAARVNAEFVMFIDDDVVAERRLVESHLEVVRSASPIGEAIVSCGPFVEPADWEPTVWNKWEALQARKEAEHLANGDYDVTWRQFHTGNNCLPIADFRAVGGFDESFKRAEDDELALRLAEHGCEFRFVPEAVAWHYSHRSLEAWLSIPRSYAVHDVLLHQLHPDAGHLAARRHELGRRHVVLRTTRAIPLRTGQAVPVVRLWVGVGRLLFGVGLVRGAMWALSAAYDLSYADALQRAEHTATSVDGLVAARRSGAATP